MCFLRFLYNTVTQTRCSTCSKDFWEMLLQGFLQCDQMAIVRLRGKYVVWLKSSGLCCSFTVQRFILLRTLYPDCSPAYWIWGGSPMPCQDEGLSYVPDNSCHRGFCSVSVNSTSSLPLTSFLTAFDLNSPEAGSVTMLTARQTKACMCYVCHMSPPRFTA